MAATPPGSPGYRIGSTYYDYQHNGSQGRQVDQSVLGGNHVVQATWMNGTQISLALGRTVYWNKMSVTGSPSNITLDNATVTLSGAATLEQYTSYAAYYQSGTWQVPSETLTLGANLTIDVISGIAIWEARATAARPIMGRSSTTAP